MRGLRLVTKNATFLAQLFDMEKTIWHFVKRMMSFIVGTLVVLMLSILVPTEPWRASYRAVKEQTNFSDDHASSKEHHWYPGSFPLYVLTNNHLFLVESYQSCSFLECLVISPEWTEAKVQAFRKAHPELENQWPHPDQADAGVEWIRSERRNSDH